MKKYMNKTPKEVMKIVTIEMIARACKMSKKKKRSIFFHKSSGGKGVDVMKLNPNTDEGRLRLENFLTPIKRQYTISGLGSPDEKNAVSWRKLNLPLPRRLILGVQMVVSLILKGTPFKNRLYRRMGVHIGKNTEIMQMVWLDHFRPELIFIGDNTLMGAYSRVTVHAYEGCGKFRYGLVEIGSNCTIGGGAGIGMVIMEDNVRILPNTTVSPYLFKIKQGSIVGWNPPLVKLPDKK